MNEHFDLIRIFIGDATVHILLEIIFRTTVLFLFTLIVMRIVGHRGLGQLSMAEFVLILSLGSAVADPMFYLEVPLIYGMVVIVLIAIYQIILTKLTVHSEKISGVIDGQAIRLVVDGMFDLKGMSAARLSRLELMAELRQSSNASLGQIERAYLELDGKISVFTYDRDEAKPGLSLLPDYIEAPQRWMAGDTIPHDHLYACNNCGYTHELQIGAGTSGCPRCNANEWKKAV